MRYSAQIHSDYRKLVREIGAVMDLDAFARLWIRENGLEHEKIPKALIDTLRPELVAKAVATMDTRLDLAEQEWQQELFKQSKRKADNERKLATKHTNTAKTELGRATRKVATIRAVIK
ncbi:hypothetical protein [Luteimonas kalidii]|uniref:Uncharacterized protein n=1 Tax=Luteimonas kalidii TaxID=3042025 RepID=A0ABT6JU73_9GAMM|nr:hypothetical protein [Luteimonas kalidii]MDH5834232.1 hypothetical protein [Luteimonas kalidii]